MSNKLEFGDAEAYTSEGNSVDEGTVLLEFSIGCPDLSQQFEEWWKSEGFGRFTAYLRDMQNIPERGEHF